MYASVWDKKDKSSIPPLMLTQEWNICFNLYTKDCPCVKNSVVFRSHVVELHNGRYKKHSDYCKIKKKSNLMNLVDKKGISYKKQLTY